MQNINIKSADEAKSWQAEVRRLNEETYQLLKDVGIALQEVNQEADSTIVDEIYKYGNQILGGANNVLEGMNKLVSTVSSLLSMVSGVLEQGVGIVKSLIGGISDF